MRVTPGSKRIAQATAISHLAWGLGSSSRVTCATSSRARSMMDSASEARRSRARSPRSKPREALASETLANVLVLRDRDGMPMLKRLGGRARYVVFRLPRAVRLAERHCARRLGDAIRQRPRLDDRSRARIC